MKEDASTRRQTQEEQQQLLFQSLDELRLSDASVQQQQDSAVQRVNETLRLAHVLSIIPSVSLGVVGIGIELSAFLAMHHLNQRSDQVLPFLKERLRDCDLHFTLDLLDSEALPTPAVRKLLAKIPDQPSLSQPFPAAVLGAGYSIPSESLAIIGGVRNVPQCSCCATSRDLDSRAEHPYFTRSTPTSTAEARAAAEYFTYLGVSHTAVVHVGDLYAQLFRRDFTSAMEDLGNAMPMAVEYQAGVSSSIKEAIQQVKESGRKYIFCILYLPDATTFAEISYKEGIMGDSSGYTWIWAQGANPFTNLEGTVVPSNALKAMNGVGATILYTPESSRFNAALQDFFQDEALVEYYISKQENQTFFEDFDLTTALVTHFALLNYDAAMAVGIAACEAPGDFFNASQLYQSILQTEFEGVTGPVGFDPDTGTRRMNGTIYKVQNVLTSQNDDGTAHFTVVDSARIDFSSPDIVQVLQPYVYADNTTRQPPALPPLVEDPNLIPRAFLITGWTLAGLVMCMAIAWAVWTFLRRKQRKVRASQPFFLFMILIGVFLVASSIIPTGFQEPMSQGALDFGCMFFVWLFCIGFVTAFSALFTKNGRINTIYQNAQAFRRVQIRPVDALLPFAILMTFNVGLLIAWTVAAPWKWQRVDGDGVDIFNRPTESYGVCKSDNHTLALTLGILLAAVNFVPVILANYQSYRSRNLPSEFNEKKYIDWCMASLLEAVLIGLPIVIMTKDEPTAFFMARSIIIFVVCLAILLFMFIPKWLDSNVKEETKVRKLPSTQPVTSACETENRTSIRVTRLSRRASSKLRNLALSKRWRPTSSAEDASSGRRGQFSQGDEEKCEE